MMNRFVSSCCGWGVHLRRFALLAVIIASLVLASSGAPQATAADTPGAEPANQLDEHQRMVNRAVAYLLKQQRGDGSINDKGNRNATAMTAMSLLAMAAVGHTPADETPEGKAMLKALEFVLRDDRQDKYGYFGGKDGSRMYGHGITALMLSELYGMTGNEEIDEEIHRKLAKAVELIVRAQRVRKSRGHEGGWRYEPNSNDSDLSLTVWQLMTLRSAKNAGFDVPKSSIDAAVEYLKRSYHSRRDREGIATNLNSGFTYQAGRNDVRFTPTSMGMLAMQVCGEYEAEEVKGSANWLQDRPPKWGERFFFYGLYYYSQGMYQFGEGLKQEGDKEEGQQVMDAAFDRVMDLLKDRQRGDGSWQSGDSSERSAGNVYCTSMAILSLSVKYHYLPIYQR